MVMSRRKIAKEIVEVIREKKDMTKNKLIQEVSKRQGVGSSTVRDLLSQLCVLG
jgi:predicted transcriptional regulator